MTTRFTDIDFTPSERDRFWSQVREDAGGCWTWSKPAADGYGTFSFRRTSVVAHRAAYMMMVGPIPDGLELDHLCRCRSCVNPYHLEPVTPMVNTTRIPRPDCCSHGHPWAENAVTYSGGKARPARRYCLTCTRDRARKSMAKRRARA